MKWTSLIAASLLGLLAFGSAASADTLSDIQARKKLIVAIDLGLPPYGTVDAAMKPTGSDVEAARLLAADLGVELEIIPATGANRIPFLQTGKVDIVMSSFSITAERKKVIDFSLPYGVISIICAAPQSDAISGTKDLEGKTIAVTRGTGADMDATKMVKADPKISIVRFDDDATLITAIASGQQDIMVSAPAQMADINEKSPGKLVTKFVVRTNGYAIGIRKGDDALKARVNAWIQKDLADGKLRDVYKQFHHADLPDVMPTE
jgi:polar amino acid transport system substrate-binding protein